MKLATKLYILLEALPFNKEIQIINQELRNPNLNRAILITLANRIKILFSVYHKRRQALVKKKEIEKRLRSINV
jgi:hypothetical protein